MTQGRLAKLMIDVYKPDKVIEIPRNVSLIVDFDQANRILAMAVNSSIKQ